jgi:hypothetical protein
MGDMTVQCKLCGKMGTMGDLDRHACGRMGDDLTSILGDAWIATRRARKLMPADLPREIELLATADSALASALSRLLDRDELGQ